jgi:hypothetical protein
MSLTTFRYVLPAFFIDHDPAVFDKPVWIKQFASHYPAVWEMSEYGQGTFKPARLNYSRIGHEDSQLIVTMLQAPHDILVAFGNYPPVKPMVFYLVLRLIAGKSVYPLASEFVIRGIKYNQPEWREGVGIQGIDRLQQ